MRIDTLVEVPFPQKLQAIDHKCLDIAPNVLTPVDHRKIAHT